MDYLTSSTACDAIAARKIRDVGRIGTAAYETIEAVLYPAFERLSCTGKFSRATYRDTWNGIADRLGRLDTLVAARFDDMRPSTGSVNDRNRARCTFMISNTDHELEFVNLIVSMTRHEISCRVWLSNVIVTSHVISRFMQRERQEATAFVRGIMDTLHAARVIMPATQEARGRRTALTFGDGLLLGETTALTNGAGSRRWAPVDLRYTKNGPVCITPQDERFQADGDLLLTIKTFVGAAAIGDSNAAIHAMLATWQATHRDGIAAASETLPPGTTPLRNADAQATLDAQRRTAEAAAVDLVRSPAWSRFSARDY